MKPPAPFFWVGEVDREVAVYGPCSCGCSPFWYLSGSDSEGHGFTIKLPEGIARSLAASTGLTIYCDPMEIDA